MCHYFFHQMKCGFWPPTYLPLVTMSLFLLFFLRLPSVYYYCQCKCILIQSRSIELGYLSMWKINCPAFNETQYRRLQPEKSAMNDIYIYKVMILISRPLDFQKVSVTFDLFNNSLHNGGGVYGH